MGAEKGRGAAKMRYGTELKFIDCLDVGDPTNREGVDNGSLWDRRTLYFSKK
jgi:hypothetical protein